MPALPTAYCRSTTSCRKYCGELNELRGQMDVWRSISRGDQSEELQVSPGARLFCCGHPISTTSCRKYCGELNELRGQMDVWRSISRGDQSEELQVSPGARLFSCGHRT